MARRSANPRENILATPSSNQQGPKEDFQGYVDKIIGLDCSFLAHGVKIVSFEEGNARFARARASPAPVDMIDVRA